MTQGLFFVMPSLQGKQAIAVENLVPTLASTTKSFSSPFP